MDGAIVNVPLRKRGDLAAQAARSVREEALAFDRRMKADRKASLALFVEAKALIMKVSDARMLELGRPFNLTAKQTREQFVHAARKNPAVLIWTMTKELEAQ